MGYPFLAVKTDNATLNVETTPLYCCQGKDRDTTATLQHPQVTSFCLQSIAGIDMVGSVDNQLPDFRVKAHVRLHGDASLANSGCELIQGKLVPDQVIVFHPVRSGICQEQSMTNPAFHFGNAGLQIAPHLYCLDMRIKML